MNFHPYGHEMLPADADFGADCLLADLDPETTAKKIMVVVKGITFSYVWSRQEVDFEGMLQIVERLVLPEPSQGDV